MRQMNRHGRAAIKRGLTSLTGSLQALRREQQGATAIFVAVAIIPLIAFVGLAVDTTRGYLVKSRLNQALDAAALAGGRVYASATRDDDIRMYFAANFPAGYLGATTTPLEIIPDNVAKTLTVSAQATVPTTFMRLLDFDNLTVASSAQAIIVSQNVEVSMVLDITGSMAGTKITDLRAAANDLVDIVVKDEQTPFYSKVALVPFSQTVNVGGYSSTLTDTVRGSALPAKAIQSITKSRTGDLTTTINARSHGFVSGDRVFITGVNNNTTYSANNALSSYSNPPNQGTPPTPRANDTRPNFWVVERVDDDNFKLRRCKRANDACSYAAGDTDPVNSSTWSSVTANTGSIHCVGAGCQYQAFRRLDGGFWITWILDNTCVTERTGANASTDAAPGTAPIGPRYRPGAGATDGNNCVASPILPLTSSKTQLHTAINALRDGGGTAGQIGTAWGWYMLSPNFASLWPADSRPAAYGTQQVLKVAIIMTDGDFNTIYNKGIIAQDSGTNSGGSNFKISQNATNGNAYTQALALCGAMKAPGTAIEVYTVGFDLANATNGQNAANFLSQCATSPSHVYLPESGTDLKAAFHDIARKISKLRLAK